MRYLLLFLYIFFSSLLLAQSTVKGTVSEQNSGKKPLAGVQIKALGTQPEVTDNVGLFQLIFNSKKPGDRIIVTEVSKKGYEVVNKKDVENWIIIGNQNEKVKIFMCPEGQITLNTAKYYSISLTAVTESYAKQIKELQEQLEKSLIDAKTYGEKAKVLGEHIIQQNQLEALADKFARENFDDCSTVLQQAFDVFKKGNVLEAIRILETVNSGTEIEKAKKQKDKALKLMEEGKDMQVQADNIISQNIDKLIFQADLYTTNLQFEKAEKSYEDIVKIDTVNFKNILSFAKYLKQQKQYLKSLVYFEKAKKLYKTENQFIDLLNEIGKLHLLQKDYLLSEDCYHEALGICYNLTLTTIMTESQKSLYATILFNYATYQHRIKNNLDSAKIYYNKSKEIFFELSKIDSLNYSMPIIMVYGGLGNVHLYKNETNSAYQCYRKAISLCDILSKKFQRYEIDLTDAYMDLGLYFLNTNQLDSAENIYKQELKTFKRLALSNPQSVYPDMSLMLYNMGILYYNKNELKLAESTFEECMRIREFLSKNDPKTYEWDYAATLNNLGFVYQTDNKLNEAEALFNNTIEILEKRSDLMIYRIETLRAYLNLADTYFMNKKFSLAEEKYIIVLNLYKELSEKQLAEFHDYIIKTYRNLSYLKLLKKQFSEAESLAISGIKKGYNNLSINVILAHALLFQGKFAKAKKIYLKMKDVEYPQDKTKTFKFNFLQDLDELEKVGITHPDVVKIRELLK